MAKSSRAYKSSKRSRELARQKKQEEKRQRRLARHQIPQPGEGTPDAQPVLEPGQDTEPGDKAPGDETPETA